MHKITTLKKISQQLNGSKFKKIKFLLRSILHKKEILALYNVFQKKELQIIIEKQPDIYNKLFRSYLYCNIPVKDKLYYIRSHYYYLSDTFKPEIIKNIYTTFDTKLLSFSLDEDNLIDVKLCYIPALGKEGELTLLISLNEKDLYSIAFSFHQEKQSLEFIIYGIQSRGIIDNNTIKFVTKKMHGVRPRNFLFFILRQICHVLNINTIKAIRSDYHVANCSHVQKTGKFKADYDQYWEEENGIKEEKFYILPLKENRKRIEDIPSKKRSMYKKRYAMLDEYKNTIVSNLHPLLQT